uniref:RNase H type-1 domain-containing protein n=1 Tax=Cajanus cajan TaxID=3821 RepID=A0A151R966_CAJCA|nr:hypothetical protein KK1_039534 [Cajanus cajan]
MMAVEHAYEVGQIVPWHIHRRWEHYLHLSSQMRFFSSHIFKEVNQCVEELVGYGIENRVDFIW